MRELRHWFPSRPTGDRRRKPTRSVADGIPTRSVGTRRTGSEFGPSLVPCHVVDAERRRRHSHAERGNEEKHRLGRSSDDNTPHRSVHILSAEYLFEESLSERIRPHPVLRTTFS